jgi:hypothetical protein
LTKRLAFREWPDSPLEARFTARILSHFASR